MTTAKRTLPRLDLEVMIPGQAGQLRFTDLGATDGPWTWHGGRSGGVTLGVTVDGDDLVVAWSGVEATAVIGKPWALRQDGHDRVAGDVRRAKPGSTSSGQEITVVLADETAVDVTVEVSGGGGVGLPISSDDVTVGADTLTDYLADTATHRVSVFADDFAADGTFTVVPVHNAEAIPRAYVAGTTILVVDGVKVGLWNVPASGPCTPAAGLTAGDVVTSVNGQAGVATTTDGVTVDGVEVQATETFLSVVESGLAGDINAEANARASADSDIDSRIDSLTVADIAGSVLSVNGEFGAVVLDAGDVGAVPASLTLTAGTGLTGGGDLSADRTLAVSYGLVADTAAEGIALPHASWRSGAYYGAAAPNVINSATAVASGVVKAMPFYNPVAGRVIDLLAIDIHTGSAGTGLLYVCTDDGTGYPGAVIASGTMSTPTTGTRSTATPSGTLTLPRGLLWLVAHGTGTTWSGLTVSGQSPWLPASAVYSTQTNSCWTATGAGTSALTSYPAGASLGGNAGVQVLMRAA